MLKRLLLLATVIFSAVSATTVKTHVRELPEPPCWPCATP